MVGLIGQKLGMTQVFDDDGRAHAVTVIKAGPNYVAQIKTSETDGYCAVQVGYGEHSEKRLSKPELGHLSKNGLKPVLRLEEFRFEEQPEYTAGQQLPPEEVFSPGDRVDVVGVSKGKGFQGVMKRHGHHGFDATHGTKTHHRRPGSMGQAAYPAKTFKNRALPGQTGGRRTTIKNLEVLKVDPERMLVFVRGSVPGARNSFLRIQKRVTA
jgi:large subunit ribosomal protein L3